MGVVVGLISIIFSFEFTWVHTFVISNKSSNNNIYYEYMKTAG